MSEKVGPVDLRDSEEHPFLGLELAQPRRFSESSAQAVDAAVHEILLEAEASAVHAIRAHRAELEKLVERLESEETLDRKQIEECLTQPRRISSGGKSLT
jgi:cell division protease FtsH